MQAMQAIIDSALRRRVKPFIEGMILGGLA
jgi:hypothetical protein